MGVVGRLDQYASMLAWEFDEYSMSENLLTYSEQFDNAAWTKTAVGISTNATTAPDGTLTAELVTEDATTTNTHWISYSTAPFTTNTYTFSIFAKQAVGSRYLRFSGFGLSAASENAIFDISSGIVYSPPTTTIFKSASIISYPNGWYRCVCNFVYSGVGQRPFFGLTNSTTNFGNYSYTGDGTSGIYLWGAQLEYGSVATDYTPTTTTAVNRVLASTTNTNITGLGTYYSSGFDENVGFTTFLSANVFAPYDPVYDEFSGTSFGAGQGRYMRQNTDKSVIVYNEIDEITDLFGRGIVRDGLVLDLDAGNTASYSGSGTTWTDLSGRGNTGTLTNGPTYSSVNGGSIVFDGADDYISVPDSTLINPGTGSFSIVAWVNSDPSNGGDGWDLWVAKRAPGNGSNGYYLGVNNPSGVRFMLGNDVNSRTDTGFVSYTYNTWAMYTAILDRTANTQTVIKNNNVEISSVTPAGGNYSNTGALSIGGDIGINAYYVNGKVANVSIYNRALTASEVSQNYNALKHRFGL